LSVGYLKYASDTKLLVSNFVKNVDRELASLPFSRYEFAAVEAQAEQMTKSLATNGMFFERNSTARHYSQLPPYYFQSPSIDFTSTDVLQSHFRAMFKVHSPLLVAMGTLDGEWLQSLTVIFLNLVLDLAIVRSDRFYASSTAMISGFSVFCVLSFFVVFLPLLRHLDKQISRTHAMIRAIPHGILMNIPHVNELIGDQDDDASSL
jgi:hypothetical protein